MKMRNELLYKCFKQGSRSIWNQFGDFTEKGFSVGEETITETTLLDLVKKMPNLMLSRKFEAAIKPFNKAEERDNGADWEWYIIDGEEWIKFLVQAKKLKTELQKKKIKMYYELKREYKDGTTQCQNLIYHAWTNGFIPIYCFYNFFDVSENEKFLPESGDVAFPADYELLGWTYCYADMVYKYEKNKTFEEMQSFTTTVASIFCSDKSIYEILEDYNDDDDDDDGGGISVKVPTDNYGGGSFLHKPEIKPQKLGTLPDYVKQMLSDTKVNVGDYGQIQDPNASPQSSQLVAVTIRVPVNNENEEHENQIQSSSKSSSSFTSNNKKEKRLVNSNQEQRGAFV
ncbi:DUF6615 family protein [Ammoniphilus sp. CFH 90114]|uniref:DUF6615 family protein n=1 Tax=Ammoniphilus sp. CFH 90114 TaxID=2493665 RepID=UPI00100E3DA7|nr:DUF6615 family protein [Ammoniphilus sp. CFH 90114]RXT14873.1 hypothetical protein EIZ39_01280 [Ammoniphilus sp. CFH 90114]